MNEVILLRQDLIVGGLLIALGLVGFLTRRNMIVMFLCAELMLQGISLWLVSWGRWHDHWGGQALVALVIAVAACEAGIALVLVLMMCQYAGNLDVVAWQTMHEESVDPYVDREVPEPDRDESARHWPVLTPAGIAPARDPEQEAVRRHV